MEFEVNNGQKIVLEQLRPGGDVFVAIRGKSEIAPHETYTSTPGDFVMMLNWYRYQKRQGNTDLIF